MVPSTVVETVTKDAVLPKWFSETIRYKVTDPQEEVVK